MDEKEFVADKNAIPSRVIAKLAKQVGLKYERTSPDGGGGLCRGIEGVKPRRRALALLGFLVSAMAEEGATDRALEMVGATWLDVMIWQQDSEYAALWGTVERMRDLSMAARVKDALWERSLNGYEVEELKGGSSVKVRKYDNGLGVQMLKGLGVIGKDVGHGRRGVVEPVGSSVGEKEDKEDGGLIDTVLFPDRQTAFNVMGREKKGVGDGT